jgi:hypothetical protein
MAKTHPENRRLGYARVSTYGQTLDAHIRYRATMMQFDDLACCFGNTVLATVLRFR